MFGGGSQAAASKPESPTISESPGSDHGSAPSNINGNGSRKKSPSPDSGSASTSPPAARKSPDNVGSGEKRSGNGSPPGRQDTGSTEKKRRSSGVGSKASSLIASAKNTLNFSQGSRTNNDVNQSPLQKLGKQDQSLAVPQGQHNNSAGDSIPSARSTFHVGVWEDRNKKCRRTMEDTHAFLYNFLHTPAPLLAADSSNQSAKSLKSQKSAEAGSGAPESRSDSLTSQEMVETDNGYFAIFDGHAGTFAADWCGKKVHLILEDVIKRNPNVPIPELLDQTFTTVDAQLEKLPLKNSGCTAAVAVLRWEDRVPNANSATGSQAIAPAAAAASKSLESSKSKDGAAQRQRVLYTANVGDARIILCRSGKALRLSYDHKGSDENEGKRITNAGGLILNNRVNGVLAVTRALGDTYIKDLVTGHPYTTETVVQPELDEFIIIACDGLWDVCSDQEAVDLVRDIQDPVAASKVLVDHALSRFSTDNLSCMIVRFDKNALMRSQSTKEAPIGVEGDATEAAGRISEAEKIVNSTRQKIAEGDTSSVGISASNSGKGHDPAPIEEGEGFKKTTLDGPVEEEPAALEDSDEPDTPEAAAQSEEASKATEASKPDDKKS